MKKLLSIIVLGLLWCNVSFGEIITLKCKKNAEHNIVELGGKEHLFKNERSYDVETAQYVSSIQYSINLMNLKILEDNRAEILVKGKKVAELHWEGSDVKEIVNGKLINSCKAIKFFTTGQPQTLTSESTPSVSKSNKSKKHNKKVAKYIKMPERVLCINYINNYGVFNKKAHQAARAEVISLRRIDCNSYMDDAYYDNERRKDEIAKAFRDLARDQGDIARENEERRARNKNKNVDCTSRVVGDRVKTSCY